MDSLVKRLRFILFCASNIKPYKMAVYVFFLKFRRFLFRVQSNEFKLDFTLSGVTTRLRFNDVDQLSYLYNLFYNKPYDISLEMKRDPVILDCGANIGMSSLYFVLKYPRAKVFAFDASIDNVIRYKENLRDFPQARVENKAIWDSLTSLDFYLSDCSRFHSALKPTNQSPVKVPTVRLDEWIRESGLKEIDILKLNVEGAELRALKGLGDMKDCVRVIVGEFHPDYLAREEFTLELRKNGFSIIRFDKTGGNVYTFEAHRRNPPS